MKINILATKIGLTPSIKKYIELKIGSLQKFMDRYEKQGEVAVFVEVARITKHHKRGNVFYAEATLRLPQKTLRAEHENSDIRVAVDLVRDALKRELKKYKEIDAKKR